MARGQPGAQGAHHIPAGGVYVCEGLGAYTSHPPFFLKNLQLYIRISHYIFVKYVIKILRFITRCYNELMYGTPLTHMNTHQLRFIYRGTLQADPSLLLTNAQLISAIEA